MNDQIVAFVPIKLTNRRLPGKNLEDLGGKPLVHWIMESLLGVAAIDRIYAYCSSTELAEYLPESVEFLRRPDSLDTDSTRINEIIAHFAGAVSARTYVLAHATAPFLSSESIARTVKAVDQNPSCDSAMTVSAHQEFFWRDGKPMNFDPLNIPRTQDLTPIFSETSGAWAFDRSIGVLGRRLGQRPELIPVSRREAVDIDDAEDLALARAYLRDMS